MTVFPWAVAYFKFKIIMRYHICQTNARAFRLLLKPHRQPTIDWAVTYRKDAIVNAKLAVFDLPLFTAAFFMLLSTNQRFQQPCTKLQQVTKKSLRLPFDERFVRMANFKRSCSSKHVVDIYL